MASTQTDRPRQRTAAPDALLDGYAVMLRMRYFEEAMQRLFLTGEIHGTVHLYTGQEAVSAGVCAALESGDLVSATYRGHGAAIGQGSEPAAMAAELMGRAMGTCGGRGGSMNLVDHAKGLLGCYGIIGGSIGSATGAALSLKRAGERRVSVAFFGDGTTNQGYFHECLNFARVHELPLLLVCENNLYGEFTPMAQVTAGADISGRAAAYDTPSARVDGNDFVAVRAAADEAVRTIRETSRPYLLEAMTYRHLGHSKSDPGTYRPKEEVAAWLERDPLKIARAQLSDEHGLAEDAIDAVEAAALNDIDLAIETALAAPYPDPATDAAREYAP